MLYTDGITEAQDPDGNDYDEERLIESLRNGCERDVVRLRGTAPQRDDVTLLIVRRNG